MPMRRICLVLILLAAGRSAAGWETLTGNLDLHCTQQQTLRIDCSYRLLIPEPPLSISARYGEKQLPINKQETYPWDGAVTAVVLLVDTSDPGRQPVIDKNKEQIRKILEQATPHHRIGLASFDSSLRVEAPIGSALKDINAAARSLRATGMTTELYRSTLKAVDLLAGVEADRKVIYLFSDGQAEDKAYFHQDVIRAARKNNVVINSLGFQRSVALSVALQTLRRLSEETGGRYVETGPGYALPGSFLERPFDNIDRGGRFNIAIDSLPPSRSGRTGIELAFATDLGEINIDMPVSGPRQPAPAASAGPPEAAPSPTMPPIRIVTTPAAKEADRFDKWLWYGVPLILVLLVLLTVVTLFLLLRKPGPGKSPHQTQPQEQFKPYAYLVSQDEKAIRHPITRTTWRIGRSRDNELTLDDNSVSRRHAEIQRLGNGKFMIHDHDSLNGIFVNDEKVSHQKLEEGDIIEIGDFYMRFTEYPSDQQQEEDTVLQKTRAPSFE